MRRILCLPVLLTVLGPSCVITRVVTEPWDASQEEAGPTPDAAPDRRPDTRPDHWQDARADARHRDATHHDAFRDARPWDAAVQDAGLPDAQPPDAEPPDAESCPPGRVRCGTDCVDLQTDPENCGACGVTCGPGAYCAGSCHCLPGLDFCGGHCVDITSDPDNCGMCGRRCPTSQPRCAAGMCVPAECWQMGGQYEGCGPASSACVSRDAMETHPLHCGDCDTACDADQYCRQGECKSFTVAASCVSCPCQECGSRHCCLLQGAVVCVANGDPCPY